MSTTYNYGLAEDFSNGIREGQLIKEIERDTGITGKVIDIEVSGNNVNIIFESALDGAEQTVLSSVVSNHKPIVNNDFRNITFNPSEKEDTVYSLVVPFYYGGSRAEGSINEFTIVSNMDPTLSSYSVRVFDVSSKLTLAEETFSNTNLGANTLSSVSNVPEDETMLELHAKITGLSGKVYIQSAKLSVN